MLNELFQQARALPSVSQPAALEFGEKAVLIAEQVNEKIKDSPNCSRLIGQNSLEVMQDNHFYHAIFMSNVLQLGLYEMLVKMVLWVYRTYSNRGFSSDYFSRSLKAWREAIQDNLQDSHAREVIEIYDWLIQQHPRLVKLSKEMPTAATHAPHAPHKDSIWEGLQYSAWEGLQALFLQNLLQGNSRASLQLALNAVKSVEDVKVFYLQVIQPTMYQIGQGWEKGEVSIAQEHLASAIISRVMSALYQDHILAGAPAGESAGEPAKEPAGESAGAPAGEPEIKKALITSAPNELHEIGAHMVSDFLEAGGWDVYYLGANTPVEEIRGLLHSQKPFLLAISVTMPFNLAGAKKIIEMVKGDDSLKDIKILAGGTAFNLEEGLWEKLGADGYAADAGQALELADKWYEYEKEGGNCQMKAREANTEK